jgi:hypothetical protein
MDFIFPVALAVLIAGSVAFMWVWTGADYVAPDLEPKEYE